MKQDVLLDQGQPLSQPAGTRMSFPPPDTEQGSEAIKTYLWSSCYKAGIVMQKRGKKTNKGCLLHPWGGDTHKDKKKTTAARRTKPEEPLDSTTSSWLVREPVLLQQLPPCCLCAWLLCVNTFLSGAEQNDDHFVHPPPVFLPKLLDAAT